MTSEMARVHPGMRVVDVAGLPVGTVGNVQPERFELRGGDGPSVWLSKDSLFVVSRSLVELICGRARIAQYRAGENQLPK